ncbi:type 4a pilus biogenesis protein PilO [Caldimonas brevitalea]|uniref:Pilus assembly protein PilO n=1 Tax=Caldimonas brevitalea TaxID=413882 RepID=A0A0G3BEB4_9BURK|nr:type 4a pilus biogenesis protein PilO [Caldimonas brevitalea]AKJ27647.1 pilus assembly protein PilO [Caldimonas brevitalea]
MAKQSFNLDLSELSSGIASQFRGLDTNEPGQWPILPKALAWFVAAVAMVVLGWFLLLSDESDLLEAERNKEPQLKQTYRDKLAQAVNLEELRKQRLQVQEYVTQLEKQLPGKAEMDALLSDINQAGLGRGLQFELFKPGQVVVKDYYAELPISVKVSGRYHDIGAFTADVANLSRIVTLHSLNISAVAKDASGALGMEATARTYRYLDQAELEEQRAQQQAEAAKGKGKGKAKAGAKGQGGKK